LSKREGRNRIGGISDADGSSVIEGTSVLVDAPTNFANCNFDTSSFFRHSPVGQIVRIDGETISDQPCQR